MSTTVQQLEELLELKACDEQTAKSLSIDDSFIQKRISEIYKRLTTSLELDSATQKDRIFNYGRKLLFLEELIQESQEAQTSVREWFQNLKIAFLFDMSSQGSLYGELLLAAAKDDRKNFLSEYNPDTPVYPSFICSKNLIIDYDPENFSRDKKARFKLLEEKLDKVLIRVKDHYLSELLEKFDIVEDVANFRDLIGYETPLYSEHDRLDTEGLEEYKRAVENLDSFTHLLSGLFPDLCENFGTYLDKIISQYKYNQIELDPAVDALLNKLSLIKQDVLKATDKKIAEFRTAISKVTITRFRISGYHEYLALRTDDINELDNLYQQYSELIDKPSLSSKLKKRTKITYSMEISEKHPLDVRFGNDSGCCIGIYEKSDSISNADGLPEMMADNAVYIFNLNQKIGDSKKRRTGIILAFETYDAQGNKVLACNSIELSPAMNPYSYIEKIVDYSE